MHEPPGTSSKGSLVQPTPATPSGAAGQSREAHFEAEGCVQKRSVVYDEDAQMPPPALQSESDRQGEQSLPSPTQVPALGKQYLAPA